MPATTPTWVTSCWVAPATPRSSSSTALATVAAIDGEAAPEQLRELEALAARWPELRAEWQRFIRLKEVTSDMTLRHPPEEIWDRYWTGTYRRVERGLGWLLLAAGATVLAAYGIWTAVEELIADTSTPAIIRMAIAATGAGAIILLLSVLREKLFTHRRDPYQKEIIR